ncbi:MAG: hypothetical protein CMK09_16935 [Ponticaulis sp.]|nr:hypothetical protein [Ponticaulis sp.]|tara:strand:- start:23917 stop:24144 length:228 start_codon:yes stop_codon:yes gene_type:complete
MMKSVLIASLSVFALGQTAMALPHSPAKYRASFVDSAGDENLAQADRDDAEVARRYADADIESLRCAAHHKRIIC